MNKYVKINDSLKSFYCECREGFSGARCEYGDGNDSNLFVINNWNAEIKSLIHTCQNFKS